MAGPARGCALRQGSCTPPGRPTPHRTDPWCAAQGSCTRLNRCPRFRAALPRSDQPEIGQWNLIQLARALILGGLLTEEEAAPALQAYAETLTEVDERWRASCVAGGLPSGLPGVPSSFMAVACPGALLSAATALSPALRPTARPVLLPAPPPQGYNDTMAAKMGLAEYDRGLAAGLMRLMYEDSGAQLLPLVCPFLTF